MEEESEIIIFSLSKGACQIDGDCGPLFPEQSEYFGQEYPWHHIDCEGNSAGWVPEGSDFTTPLADVVELKCGDGRWYDGWYACHNNPAFVNPPWGSPVCRCAEPSDEAEYGMPEGWYESVGKHLVVFFACGWRSPAETWHRTGDPNDSSTWSSFVDSPCSGIGIALGGLSFGWGFLGAIGDPPRSEDYTYTSAEGIVIEKLEGGHCCNNECQYCPCLYEVCPMEQSRIDPPYPDCLVGLDDPHFCVPEGWKCQMYVCYQGGGEPDCHLYNGWQALNCVDMVCNYCSNSGFYVYNPPCIQPASLIDKGACVATCTPSTPTGGCETVTYAAGTLCKVTGDGCGAGKNCTRNDPNDRSSPCSCQSSYLSSRLVEDFSWKGSSPP